MPIAFDHVLDASGLYCPEPVMMLHNKIREVGSGEVLKVMATDPSTQRDIPKFCIFLGHELIDEQHGGDSTEKIGHTEKAGHRQKQVRVISPSAARWQPARPGLRI
jgi:tRNA 2-thiouridine synthesizing protein A